VADAEVGTGLEQRVVHPDGLVARHVELPPELAEVGHADRVGQRHADLDLLGPQIRECLVGEVGRGEA
jgi:hypothetical protein